MVNKINYPPDLPIVAWRAEIIAAIKANRVVIVAGETGSGKTTQLPKMCVEAGRGAKAMIGCTQPRRIAALTIAARVKEELGPAAAHLVGAKVRFHDQTTRATRIKFMTDGILLAEAQHDRLLRGYDTIIVDEAHERTLNIDFLLGILHRLLARRPDLKVIVTSATIDTAKFANHFQAPVITVSGRGYPVEVIYRPAEDEEQEGELSPVERAVTAVRELRRLDRQGDVLVFMPTERDIMEMVETLQRQEPGRGGGEFANAAILPLFGRMAAADQSRIFRPAAGQKIVIATNVAETSVTVPGIRYVVDTGLARVASYNVRARTTKLPVVAVSRASADQRRGRCGRVGPGICIRLYSQEDYENRPEFTLPEIQRANLAEVILRMLSLQLGDPARFPFLDPPTPRSIKDGYELLDELGAIRRPAAGEQGGIALSHRGRIMARLPLDPRIARMIIAARDENALSEVVVIAAALSIQDPRLRPPEKEKEADAAHAQFAEMGSDFFSFLKIWQACQLLASKSGSQNQVRKFCQRNFLSFQRWREWRDVHGQICQVLAEEGSFTLNSEAAHPDGVHRAILSGSLRHIGYKKEKNLYLGGQGKELVVFPGSALANKAGQWIMAAELVETSRLYARTVANIRPEWLEGLAGSLCRYSYSDPHWEKKRGQVVASEKVTLFGLVIVAGRKVNFGRVRPEEARQLFIEALVAGELEGEYKFLRHNRQLVLELEEVENRVRQRDILVDDYRLTQFYEQRLPAEIWDQASLNRQRREMEARLRMTLPDITNQEPDRDRLAEFPVSVDTGDFSLPLSYKFQPGHDADGVSVMIPMTMVGEVQADRFEWLVPGLLLEKIVCLLKGLPKGIRKQLVPIPQTAKELLDALPLNQGSLYAALEREIRRRFGVAVARKQWPVAALPPHLTVRYCLLDQQGQAVQTSRELHGLQATAPSPSTGGGSWPELQKKWEREGVTTWDFAELPARIPLKNEDGALTGFVYPALVHESGGGIALRLLPDPAASRSATRAGLLALYLLSFKKQVQAARKEFGLTTKEWALNEGFAPLKKMNEGLLTFILEELFAVRDGTIPSREVYAATIARVEQEGLLLAGQKIFTLQKEVLVARRQVLDLIGRYATLPGAGRAGLNGREYRRQLAHLLPEDFLAVFDLARLQAVPRYLKALAIRVERAHADPAKDQVKAAQAAVHEERLRQCLGQERPTGSQELLAERRQLLAEYGGMIEEFKVSLFAPEVKTAFPISGPRLEKKWLELERVY